MGRAVNRTLYWYLRSNRGRDGSGIDSGIILSQAALELLASAYLEAQKIKMPARGRTADQLREVLRRLGIPVAIPDGLAGLLEGQRQNAGRMGPRQSLASGTSLFIQGRSCRSSWEPSFRTLGAWLKWYIELLILRLSGYSGQYSNRLEARWVGEVEDVPWA
jgi:hypothetical protein